MYFEMPTETNFLCMNLPVIAATVFFVSSSERNA